VIAQECELIRVYDIFEIITYLQPNSQACVITGVLYLLRLVVKRIFVVKRIMCLETWCYFNITAYHLNHAKAIHSLRTMRQNG
jgi:hypothetical protein